MTSARLAFVVAGLLAAVLGTPEVIARDALRAQHAAERAKTQTGVASVYAKRFDGRTAASGETYDDAALTAAHRTLDFGTEVKVTNLRTHRSVVVRINDRGPAVKSRIIDLSPAAARAIGMRPKGLARVRLEVVKQAPNDAAGPPGS